MEIFMLNITTLGEVGVFLFVEQFVEGEAKTAGSLFVI